MTDISEVLSGHSGVVAGRRQRARAVGGDLADFALRLSRLELARLRHAARAAPPRSVLVTGVYSAASARTMAALVRNLRRSKHDLSFALGSRDETAPSLASQTKLDSLGGGKFENVNALLAAAPASFVPDWTLVVDDDIELPGGFLNRFLFLAERFGFQLCQPALTQSSHAAWDVMRRRHDIARRTRMVEIGPLTAFHRSVAGELLPFPDLRMGWGLDSHWGGLALERDWKLGVVDATAIRHRQRPTAATYDRAEAVAEAERFLEGRVSIDRNTALTVVESYRSWR